MNRNLFAALALVATTSFAQGSVLEPLVRRAIPDCGEVKLAQEDLKMALPPGFSGKVFRLESAIPGCAGQYAAILSPKGNFFLGSPWPIKSTEGSTPAERIRIFGQERLREIYQPTVSTQPNADGLLPVDVQLVTEFGKIPIRGFVDPAGTVFFPGIFFPVNSDFTKVRLETLAPVLKSSPSLGPANAPMTLVEFSDFQCPSCRNAAKFLKPILDKHKDRIRYTRVDFPLVTFHPWAFGASMMGRAIYRQSPEAFWKFKDAIYDNQANLNMFTLEDFGRGFVSDHSLNVDTFNADIASEEIKRQVLDSIGAAYALQVQGTPTFLLNGVQVVAGGDGKTLEAAIARALSK